MTDSALIAALHGGHAGGVDFGSIVLLASSLLVILVLAISSAAREVRRLRVETRV